MRGVGQFENHERIPQIDEREAHWASQNAQQENKQCAPQQITCRHGDLEPADIVGNDSPQDSKRQFGAGRINRHGILAIDPRPDGFFAQEVDFGRGGRVGIGTDAICLDAPVPYVAIHVVRESWGSEDQKSAEKDGENKNQTQGNRCTQRQRDGNEVENERGKKGNLKLDGISAQVLQARRVKIWHA